MAAAEAKRPDRIDAVSIVTPNHLHFAPAKAFLEAGIHVICDKPLTTTVEDARHARADRKEKPAEFSASRTTTPAIPSFARRAK